MRNTNPWVAAVAGLSTFPEVPLSSSGGCSLLLLCPESPLLGFCPPFKHLLKGGGSAFAFSDFSAALNILVLSGDLSPGGFLTSSFSWLFRVPSVSYVLDSDLWGDLVELIHSQTQLSSCLLIMLLRICSHLLSFPSVFLISRPG